MSTAKFFCHHYYHIFNRSIGYEKLFITENDYYYFKKKLRRFLLPHAEIFSYCLLPDHFHLLINMKGHEDLSACVREAEKLSDKTNGRVAHKLEKSLNNFFSSYARSYNNSYHRHGKLFQQSYKFKEITDETYLIWLIHYIHRNPVHHGYSNRYDQWEHSSYNDIIKNNDKLVRVNRVIDLFGGRAEFIKYSELMISHFNNENILHRSANSEPW